MIFSSKLKDFMYLFFPGLAYLLFLEIGKLPEAGSWITLVSAWVFFNIINVGHTYSTTLRTLLDPQERKRSALVWQAPLFIFITCGAWIYFKIPFFWAFVFYMDVWHNLKQGLGIAKWYGAKSKSRHQGLNKYFYALTILPFLAYHIRDKGFTDTFYSPTETPLFFNTLRPYEINLSTGTFHGENWLFDIILILYLSSLASWIFYEVKFALEKRKIEGWRISYLAFFFLTYAYAFFLSESFLDVILIGVTHGVAYLFIMHDFGSRTKRIKYYQIALILIITSGAFFNDWSEGLFKNIFYYDTQPVEWWENLLLAAYISPILSHFFFDAYLWKKNHPDAPEIYGD